MKVTLIDSVTDLIKQQLEKVDVNRNGVPDYRDPAVLEFAWGLLLQLVKKHLPENSPVRAAFEAGEQVRTYVAGTAELEEGTP